jgi:hypothetical protein
MMPSNGTSTFSNIEQPRRTSFRATSCGVVTMTAPVSGTSCDSEICTSPVPGGRSMMR